MMKIYSLLILAISTCFFEGCSTNVEQLPSVAGYEGNPGRAKFIFAPYKYLPTAGDIQMYDEHYQQMAAKADILLETENWDEFEETKPADATANARNLAICYASKSCPVVK